MAYGFAVRELKGGAFLPVGYSNGQFGYLPTAAQLAVGGHEGTGSVKGGLPSPLVPDAEQLTLDATKGAVS